MDLYKEYQELQNTNTHQDNQIPIKQIKIK